MPDKKKILASIKSNFTKSGSSYIKLPSHISMKWIQLDTIKMHFTANLLIENMQEDKASFESWAAILKRWVPQINKILISWDPPINPNDRHYQRFLFRLIHFNSVFDWFKIENSCLNYLSASEYGKSGNKYYINKPGKRTPPKQLNTITVSSRESDLESYIYNNPNNLINICSLTFLNRQLPVGVFKDKVSNGSQIFSSGKSAVDLWGITNDNKLSIFELKNNKNKKAGIITEMLFYSFIIRNLQNGLLQMSSNTIDEKLITARLTRGINAFILAPSIHSLIDKSLIQLLNKGLMLHNIMINGILISDSITGNLNYSKF